MRLLLIVGPSRYRSLDHLSQQLARGFEQCGWRTDLFCTATERQRRLRPKLYDLVVSPNGTASMVRLGEELLFDQMGVPQILWMVDDPIHAVARYRIGAQRALYTCVDADHLVSARKLTDRPVYFCPSGASELEWREEERSIELLLCGSYRPAESSYPSGFLELMEREREQEPRAAWQLLEEGWGRPFDWSSEADLQWARWADLYLRGWRRDQLLDLLAKAGLVVDLYGVGWESSPHGSRHRLHKPLEAEAAMQLLGQARLVLDSPTHFGYGPHERTLTALLAGAVPVTYLNRYYADRFVEGEELIGYRWSDLEGLSEKIASLLQHEPRRREVATAGAKRVLAGELWSHRAERMIEIFREQRDGTANSSRPL